MSAISWFLGWALDATPWWLWAVGAGVLFAATYQLWLPLWSLLPSPVKAALIAIGAATLAYLAGRNKGAAGALQRAKEQEQARADDIAKNADRARARADRDAVGGGLMKDDGFKRRD